MRGSPWRLLLILGLRQTRHTMGTQRISCAHVASVGQAAALRAEQLVALLLLNLHSGPVNLRVELVL